MRELKSRLLCFGREVLGVVLRMLLFSVFMYLIGAALLRSGDYSVADLGLVLGGGILGFGFQEFAQMWRGDPYEFVADPS